MKGTHQYTAKNLVIDGKMSPHVAPPPPGQGLPIPRIAVSADATQSGAKGLIAISVGDFLNWGRSEDIVLDRDQTLALATWLHARLMIWPTQ